MSERSFKAFNAQERRMRSDERASGIDPEMTEIDVMLEEMCDKEEVAEEENGTKKKKAKAEKEKKACTVFHGSGQWICSDSIIMIQRGTD